MDCRKPLLCLLPLFAAAIGCTTVTTPDANSSIPAEPQQKVRLLVAAADCASQAANSAHSLSQQQEVRETARKKYELALASSPKFVPALEGLANLYDQMGDQQLAQTYYQKAVEGAPQDARLRYKYGRYEAKHKDWSGAVAAFRVACKLDPGNHQYAKTLAFTLACAGRTEESLACFTSIGMSGDEARDNVARMSEYIQGQSQPADELQSVDLQPDE